MYRWTILIALLVASACTVDEGREPTEETNNQTTANNTSANVTTNAAPNIAANSQPFESTFSLRVAAIEWGVLPESVDETPATVLDEVSGLESHSFELSPGVHRLTFVVDGVEYELSDDRLIVSPVGTYDLVESDGDGPRVFAPDTLEFEVTVMDGLQVRLMPSTGAGPELALDEPGHASGIAGLFYNFLSNYDPTGEDRSAVFALLEGVHLKGGAPVQTDAGHLFLVPSVPGDDPDIRGSFNNWERTAGFELRQLVPGLSVRFVPQQTGRHAYKVAYGESWTTDRANRHIEWDGFDPGTVGSFNSVLQPEVESSRLVLLPNFESSELGNERDIYVYLPESYAVGENHPLLIAHDGNESIVRGQFHEVIDAWSTGKAPSKQPVVAFVALAAQDQRMAEYTFASEGARGDDYATFLVDGVLPFLRERFRLSSDRTATGLVGASLGGLISYHVLTSHSETFGYAAGMSSSFFWADNAMLSRIEAEGCFDADFYLDSGSPNDNFVVTQQMRDLLDSKGCRYRYVLDEGGTHEWWKWNERLPGVLDHFAEVVP